MTAILFTVISTYFLPVHAQTRTVGNPKTIASLRNDTSLPLRELPLVPPLGRPREGDEIPNRLGFKGVQFERQLVDVVVRPDPVVQSSFGSLLSAPPLVNFDGMANVGAPPDPNIDVGPNHVIQTVNSTIAIYGKTGNLLWGPANIITLWNGFPGPWSSTNDGDPIVMYDPLSDRWLISEFSWSNSPPFYELIAVSQTSDPLGSYHRYAFSFTEFPDYPKLAVWPDGYYMSIDTFAPHFFRGPSAVAFQRDSMLAGRPALAVFFQLTSDDHMLPSDLDGTTLPPAGSPNYFARAIDGEISGGSDRVELYEFHTDWGTPSNSTFSGPTSLLTASFDRGMCDFPYTCIPQPSTSAGLDALPRFLMYRLQYRNFGAYQTMVLNHIVDATGSDQAGIRWYELRNPGGGWNIYQQSTYSPDTTHRWVGSVAMNGQGNIALGFSASSSTTFPSIRYTGRHAGDPLGTMTINERTIIAGSGAQTDPNGRWGDYSSLVVDPSDDETFWYTNEYLASTSFDSWRTRIASFKFDSISTSITEENAPAQISLRQNYPNPFNPVTNFKFSIGNSQLTILKVYDLLGREVATLVNEVKAPGSYEVTFNASELASGVYLYRLHAGAFTETKKLILMR